MDGTATKMKSFAQPKTLVELLPDINSILSKDSIQTLTAKKQSRNTMALSGTSENVIKPLTIAEMKTHLKALKSPSPRRYPNNSKNQPNNSVKKKNWNSSVKVDKTISHTANGHLKHHQVRKTLNYSPKFKAPVIARATINSETPKFHKPEQKVKKTLNLQGKSSVRVNGVSNIAETPTIKNNPSYKNRMTLANKENYSSSQANINTKNHTTPKLKPLLLKKTSASVPDTPLSNMSWRSSCDASFLRTEKALQDIDDKTKALEEKSVKNIAEVTQPVSTPFKKYRNVEEFFNNTNDSESSALYNDNTIMCFDKVNVCKETSANDVSVIVSLCELLNKATVNNCDKKTSELDDLLKVQKQTEQHIQMIGHGIRTLTKIKESQMHSLQCIRKLINEKR